MSTVLGVKEIFKFMAFYRNRNTATVYHILYTEFVKELHQKEGGLADTAFDLFHFKQVNQY